MTKHYITMKYYVCDILGERCAQKSEDEKYNTDGPNCSVCDIANKPKPVDSRIPQSKFKLKLI